MHATVGGWEVLDVTNMFFFKVDCCTNIQTKTLVRCTGRTQTSFPAGGWSLPGRQKKSRTFKDGDFAGLTVKKSTGYQHTLTQKKPLGFFFSLRLSLPPSLPLLLVAWLLLRPEKKRSEALSLSLLPNQYWHRCGHTQSQWRH